MAAFSTIATVVSAAAAVGGVASSIQQGKANKKAQAQQLEAAERSNKLREEAEKKQREIADLQAARQRREAARQAQERRAQIVASAEQAGVSGSSGVSGATGSVQTQAASNLSFLDQTSRLSSQAAELFGDARTISNTPIFADTSWATAGSVFNAVGTFAAGRSGMTGSITDLFGSSAVPTGMYNGGTGTDPSTGLRYGGV